MVGRAAYRKMAVLATDTLSRDNATMFSVSTEHKPTGDHSLYRAEAHGRPQCLQSRSPREISLGLQWCLLMWLPP